MAQTIEPSRSDVKQDYSEQSLNSTRIYSQPFCLYCERVIIAAHKKSLRFEVINVDNLEDIPDWFYSKNPEGVVPVLEHNGKLVNGSQMIIEYLDDVYPEISIVSKEPLLRAKQRYDAFKLESVCNAIRKISYSKRLTGNIDALAMELAKAEELLQSSFYSGETLGLPDIVLFPFIQRLFMIRKIIKDNFLDKVFPIHFSKLENWFTRMRTLPEVIIN
uniref:Glutathione S-transferase omega n=1 Tax=Onchocerca volvulus TaxID=6282 RepID=A0A8R1TLS4_ONCVO